MDRYKKNVLKKINKGEIIYHTDIVLDYRDDLDIIAAEKDAGIRVFEYKGYDIIRHNFFIHEKIRMSYQNDKENWEKEIRTFDNFDDYYEYLNGEIYENACYYQCRFPKSKYKIDRNKFYEKNTLIETTIDDYTLEQTDKEKQEYKQGEERKKRIKEWIIKFNKCTTYEGFINIVNEYKNSSLKGIVDLTFFIYNYIFFDVKDTNRFDIIMRYMSEGLYPEIYISKYLCHIYDPDEVVKSYNYCLGAKSTRDKHKRNMKKYAERVKSGEIIMKDEVFFDEITHYFCIGQKGVFGVKRYFETLEELLNYRKNDLSNADLSKFQINNYDFSKIKINDITKLPINNTKNYKITVKKKYEDNCFIVVKSWYDEAEILVKEKKFLFRYISDFISFLKGDLSSADLLMCDGLINLNNIDGIEFTNAELTSEFCDKFGITYESYTVNDDKIDSFEETIENEQSTKLVRQSSRDMIDVTLGNTLNLISKNIGINRIYYISDLHIVHKIINGSVRKESDVNYIIKKIVYNLVNESIGVLLIAGDTSCDFEIFKKFVRFLREEIDNKKRNTTVIFTLGNHELWGFSQIPFESILEEYETFLKQYGMYLLESNILYMNDNHDWKSIARKELKTISKDQLREKLRESRIILFGGLAFSGCDTKFNANQGIYRKTISRKQEIKESAKFNLLYEKVVDNLPDKKVIICTHMPKDCWSKNDNYHKNFIYVSGHTHNNYFYDDGEIRIYSDNQIGYFNDILHTKYFELDNDYDYMCDYEEGIYEISADDIKKFYRGKNISLNLNWQIHKLYMLKKQGYYCFIHESPKGSLSILNGGARRSINKKEIEYYYDNMDRVINKIKRPLDKYMSIQKIISDEIKKIGGSGFIHGCIIDINFFNHIYLNPYDLKITPYYALNMIYKTVYRSVPLLLEKECPDLYWNYLELQNNQNNSLSVISCDSNLTKMDSQIYLNTDIYKASREICRMKKLCSNILSIWIESDGASLLEKNI